MKIVHLVFAFICGGSENMLADIVNQQINKAEVDLVIINNIYSKTLLSKIDKRVKVHFINRTEGSRNIYPVIKLNLLLLKLRPDVLHCHTHNIGPLLVPQLRYKAVLTVHDVGISTRYFKIYKKLFAVSQIVKRDIYNRSGIEATLVYNGISINNILQRENNTSPDGFKTVIVSRLVHEKKGQHLAIEALDILRQKGISNIRLDLIGSGSSESYLKELTAKYKLSDRVIFLGSKDRDYIYSHLKDYDLLLQPSLYEGFGLTVAEAMAAKVPVLVSDKDGPMEIIEEGKYGFFFKNKDAAACADGIIKIISINDNDRDELLKNACKRAHSSFSIEKTAEKYLQCYS